MFQEKTPYNDYSEGIGGKSSLAFRQLVESQKNKVLNICYRFVHNKEDAEDMAQETFIEVHRSLAELRNQSDLSAWIYRIAVSKSLNFIRMQKRQKRGGKMGKPISLDDEIEGVSAPAATNPDEALAQKERRRILQEALGTLPKNQQIAFVLSKYDGMSYEEIAAVLQASLPAVESLIHRAKINLQKELYGFYHKKSNKEKRTKDL